jgi:hypothetical protein
MLSSTYGIVGDIRFQLERNLPEDLRQAYERLLDRAAKPGVKEALLREEYNRLATLHREWLSAPEQVERFTAGFAIARAEQDRQHAVWAEERRLEAEEAARVAAEQAAREAEEAAVTGEAVS